MTKKMSRDKMIEMLKMAEMEEGRTGLLDAYLKENPAPEDKKGESSKKKKED